MFSYIIIIDDSYWALLFVRENDFQENTTYCIISCKMAWVKNFGTLMEGLNGSTLINFAHILFLIYPPSE